jgi:hypothetical protein
MKSHIWCSVWTAALLPSFAGAACLPPNDLAGAAPGLTARFTAAGAQLLGNGVRWQLTPVAYGRGSDLRLVQTVSPRMNARRVEYRHPAITEWYQRGSAGLEQGFTVARRPNGAAGGLPLTIALPLPAMWAVVVDKNRAGITLTGPGASFRYAGLAAKDVKSKALRTWLDVQGDRLLLNVDDTGAQYPLAIDPTIQSGQLKPSSDSNAVDFGDAVAVDGNTVVVGAMLTLLRDGESGSAYVYEKPANGWGNMTQTATLTPSDNAGHFGASVAISGDTIVIGAPYTTVGGAYGQGALYVFVKPTGGWKDMTETAKLTPYHVGPAGNSWVGTTVSISGNTIVAGGPNVAPQLPALGEGEAFVYVKPTTGWTNAQENAVLYVGGEGTGFGASVGVSGGTIVVGATGCCVQGSSSEGAAYVFVEPPGGWATTYEYSAELMGTEVGAHDFFGAAVAIAGNTVVVGSPQTYSYQVGAAYVYVKPAGGWRSMTQTAELYPLYYLTGNFGSALAISGNSILIGAPNTQGPDGPDGVAYLFAEPQGGWVSTSAYNLELTDNSGLSFGSFGQSVSISGATMAIGISNAAEVFSIIP